MKKHEYMLWLKSGKQMEKYVILLCNSKGDFYMVIQNKKTK